MSLKRRLLTLWLAASLAWMVFAFLYVIQPLLGEFDWTALEIAECIVLLLGIPLAGLCAGIAIYWIVKAGER
jgi:hypothetical protein